MALPTNVVQGNAAHVTHHNTIHALMPTGESVMVKTKSGVPVDGDFTSTPANGTIAYNTSTNIFYVRVGGVWVAAIGSGAQTSIANTFTQAQTINGGSTATDRLNLGADVSLYRESSNNLKTDDNIYSAGELIVQHGSSTRVRVGNEGPAGQAGIRFGDGDDTNLYRVTFDTLRTDDSFQIKGPSPWIDVKAHGAIGDGSTDDTTAIQAAINAAPNPRGIVYLSAGDYKVSGTILFDTKNRMKFFGPGRFIWNGNSTDPLIRVWGSRDCVFEGFSIQSGTPNLNMAILLETKSGTTITANKFRDIYIDGTNTNGLQYGIRCLAGSGGDANNDAHSFSNVQITNYTTCGASFEHSQSKTHWFHECVFSAVPNISTSAGVATNRGTGTQGGSFTWYSGAINFSGVACFDIGSPNDYIKIYDLNAEENDALIVTPVSGNYFNIRIMGVRWDLGSASLPATGRIVSYGFRGPFFLENCNFSTSTAVPCEIYFNSGGSSDSSFIARGNYIESSLSNPFTGNLPTEAFDNLRSQDAGSSFTRLATVRRD